MARDLFTSRESHARELSDPVLGLLRREDADWYISLVEYLFPTLTDRLKKDVVLEKLERAAADMIVAGNFPKRHQDGGFNDTRRQELALKLYRALLLMPESGYGYGWLREDPDQTTKELFVTVTSDAVRALDLLRSMSRTTRLFTGAKVDVFKEACLDLRDMVSPDLEQRIARLEAQRAQIDAELNKLGAGGDVIPASPVEIEDKLALIEELVSPLPAAIRRIAEKEGRNAANLAERIGNLDLRSDELIKSYVDTLADEFAASDDGQSFRRAEEILKDDFFDTGMEDLLDVVQSTVSLNESSRSCAKRIGERNEEIRYEIWNVNSVLGSSSGVIARLARRNQGGRYRDLIRKLEQLRICFANWAGSVKGQNPEAFELPYGGIKPSVFAIEPAVEQEPSAPAPLDSYVRASAEGAADELALLLRMGPPKVRETIMRMLEDPVIEDGHIDVVASFNRLPASERLIQDMQGVLTRLGSGSTLLDEKWAVFDAYGNAHYRLSAKVMIPLAEIDEILEEV